MKTKPRIFQMRVDENERSQMTELSKRLSLPRSEVIRLALSRLAAETSTPAAQPAQPVQDTKTL